jgi:hypothetical protein
LHAKAPLRYYKFGLIDPHDAPYATFRFYYRTWAEIDALGLHLGSVEGDNTSIFTADTAILDLESRENSTVHLSLPKESVHVASTTQSTSVRGSISQEYFTQYPTPELLPNNLVIPPAPPRTHRRAMDVTPFSSQASVDYWARQQSIGYPSVQSQRSGMKYSNPTTYNPYSSYSHYQGNAFAKQYNAAAPIPSPYNKGSHAAYSFLPPGHPHSTNPAATQRMAFGHTEQSSQFRLPTLPFKGLSIPPSSQIYPPLDNPQHSSPSKTVFSSAGNRRDGSAPRGLWSTPAEVANGKPAIGKQKSTDSLGEKMKAPQAGLKNMFHGAFKRT